MADEFDPLKNTTSASLIDVTKKTTEIEKKDSVDDDLLDLNTKSGLDTNKKPTVEYKNISHQLSDTTDSIYDRLDVKRYSNKSPMRSNEQSRDEKSSLNTENKSTRPQNPTRAYYVENRNQYSQQSENTGLLATVDRIIQRFPALGIFFPSANRMAPAYNDAYEQEEVLENQTVDDNDDDAPQLVDIDEDARELTAEEIAVIERYEDVTGTKLIPLQKKDKTKPVGVAVHYDTDAIYLCDVGRSLIEIYNLLGELENVIDDQIISNLAPSSIAVTDDGTIIVASESHHRLHLYAPTSYTNDNPSENDANNEEEYYYQQFKLGSNGTKLHQFQNPSGIAVDAEDGYIYVCDQGNFRIQVISPGGICERSIELIVNDEEPYFCAPIQIAHQYASGFLVCLVAGDALCFIPKTASGPIEVETFSIVDNEERGLRDATNLAIDDQDRIFISDTGNHRIVVCTPEGYYLGHFGTEGDQPGQLKSPTALAFTKNGTLVVADTGNQRLQLFGLKTETSSTNNSDEANKHETASNEEKHE